MDQLTALYDAVNARDADALAALLAPDADWPEAITGGRVVGRDAVTAHWRDQWAVLRFDLHPRLMRRLPDGRVEVLVDQVVHDVDGDLLSESVVQQVYSLDPAGLVRRMDVGDPAI